MIRKGNKLYQRIPGGEIQFGLISRCLFLWFRGRPYRLKKPDSAHIDYHWGPKRAYLGQEPSQFECGKWKCPYREKDGA